jgi:hypothetical protein
VVHQQADGSKGLATGVASGTTVITSTMGSVTATASLTVTGGGVAALTWDAPTTRTDGSHLNAATDDSQYKIYNRTAATQTYTV